MNNIFLVHYCHPNCTPFQNIMRLPREKAFLLADKMARENFGEKAFGRFEDFENYYPIRLQADERLYENFVALGGKPKEHHPLHFVVQGSDYLKEWFGNGRVYQIPLEQVCKSAVSFTIGDSCARFQRTGQVEVLMKEQLFAKMNEYDGSIEKLLEDVKGKYSYIEAQVWDDRVISKLEKIDYSI